MSRYTITYIYHDCFLIETDEVSILFDYWKDPLADEQSKDFPPVLDEINPHKPLYVLISHHHKDHFSRRIFKWYQRFPRIRYIISPDVYRSVKYLLTPGGNYIGNKPPLDIVTMLTAGESYQDSMVKVEAFDSTDIGNSYVVKVSGYNFFHAGDLNAWLWLDESTPEEIHEARSSFMKIVASIKDKYPSFDIVFFPLDSRLGREYWWGADYFVSQIKARVFIPMHFELVLAPEEKEQRRMDAAAFNFFNNCHTGAFLQLAATRSKYVSPFTNSSNF